MHGAMLTQAVLVVSDLMHHLAVDAHLLAGSLKAHVEWQNPPIVYLSNGEFF